MINITKFICILFTFVFLFSSTVPAVILLGSGDTNYNTTPPIGELTNSGWQHIGYIGMFTMTPIAPNYFIAAKHIGGQIGQTVYFEGLSYTTIQRYDDLNSDLRIWKVAETFPYFSPLYTNNNELGKSMVVFGRGTQRGEPVIVSATLTTFSTNVCNLKRLGISKLEARELFPDSTIHGQTMTVITINTIQTNVLQGWKNGVSDHFLRWGENVVTGVGTFLVSSFDNNGNPNECYLSSGDSSGPCFIQDDDGIWKLAAINYGVEGPFQIDQNDIPFYGAIYDRSGLYRYSPYDGVQRPSYFYSTRISDKIPWIISIINQL